MGYIGMCSPKGYGISAVLDINGESILATLVINWLRFCILVVNWVTRGFLELRSYVFIINIDNTKNKTPSQIIMFRATVSVAMVKTGIQFLVWSEIR